MVKVLLERAGNHEGNVSLAVHDEQITGMRAHGARGC